MLNPVLQEFVDSLDPETQEAVSGKRGRGVIRYLEEHGIDVPQEVYEEMNMHNLHEATNEELLDTMRKFDGSSSYNGI